MNFFHRRKSRNSVSKQPEIAPIDDDATSKKDLLHPSAAQLTERHVYEKGDDVDNTASPATTLPLYQEPESSSSVSRTMSQPRSTAFSSTGSSELGPDVNPVTHNDVLSADFEKEVYIPNNGSTATPASLPMANRARQASRTYREYNFYYTNAMTHLIICDPDHRVLSFAEMSPFAKGMSDVSMRTILEAGFDDIASKGPSMGLKEAQSAPVTAVADELPTSMHIKIGIGDPNEPQSQKWSLVQNVHYDPKSNSERYEANYKLSDGTELKLLWIRGAGEDASDKGDSRELYRVLSDEGLIASFRAASLASVKKRGALRVYDIDSPEVLGVIFTTCTALLERERKRKLKKGLLMGFSSSKKS